jgi:hypothetical protein
MAAPRRTSRYVSIVTSLNIFSGGSAYHVPASDETYGFPVNFPRHLRIRAQRIGFSTVQFLDANIRRAAHGIINPRSNRINPNDNTRKYHHIIK